MAVSIYGNGRAGYPIWDSRANKYCRSLTVRQRHITALEREVDRTLKN